MLKLHLSTLYNMTRQQYRERWNLQLSYPMTAPAYAAQRSDLTNQVGLGMRPKSAKTPGDKVSVSAQEAILPEPAVSSTTKMVVKPDAKGKKRPEAAAIGSDDWHPG
jgi:hypothetical protein